MKKNINIKKKDNVIFGIFFFIFFILFAFYPIKTSGVIKIWFVFFSLICLVITIFAPDKFTSLNKLWIQLGYLLGNMISPIVMGLIFFCVVTPIGLFIRLLNNDVMRLKKNKFSYWINRKDKIQSMKKQF
jgi:cell division protein FtsW (lipid II flippase)